MGTSGIPLSDYTLDHGPRDVEDLMDSAIKPRILRGSARFHQVLQELGVLHDKKQTDYGRTGDPFSNVRASEEFGIPGWVGCMIRANDKMRRIQKFAKEGSLANESVTDSLLDLAVYSIIALVLYEEESCLPKSGPSGS